MIIEVILENLFSFKDKITFNMNSNIVNINSSNNSGKSNLFKILNFVSIMLRNKVNNIPLTTYMYNKNFCKFEITFLKENTKYTYGFSCNSNKIDKEYLYYYSKDEKNLVYKREDNKFTFKDKKLKSLSKGISDNRLFLSYVNDYDKLKDAYTFLTVNIGICLDIKTLIEPAFKIYEKDVNNKLKPYIIDFYKRLNINIIDYNIKSIIIGNGKGYSTKFKHTSDNKNYIIDYGDESLSNRIVFAIIPFILMAKEEGKVLILDDLDSLLDNKIISEIINIFNNKGQLIFSSRNTYDLNCKLIMIDSKK